MTDIIATKKFPGGYVAEIEPNVDRPGVDCIVRKGDYQASLACLENEGHLWWNGPGSREDLIVPERVADEIGDWVRDNFDY